MVTGTVPITSAWSMPVCAHWQVESENLERAKGAEKASCGEMVVQKACFRQSVFFSAESAPLRFALEISENLGINGENVAVHFRVLDDRFSARRLFRSFSAPPKNVRSPNHHYFSKKYRNTLRTCIAIRLQFVLQYFWFPYTLRKGKECQYSSHVYLNTAGSFG